MIMEPQAQAAAARADPGGRKRDLRFGAFRPLDVYPSRKGITVEIGNTDAEGRLVLADALALADEEAPELLIDMGTLTGAARVALGPDLPPFYTDDDALAAERRGHRARRRTIRSGACRCGRPTAHARIRRSPTPTTCRAAASRARSPARCSSRASSTAAKAWLHFDIYAWTADRQTRRGPRAASARPRARSTPALGARLMRMTTATTRASRRPGPILRRKHLEGKVAAARFVDGAEREVIDAAGAGAARAGARRAAGDRGAARASVSRSTRKPTKAGPGASSRADGYVGWLPANALARARCRTDPQGLGVAHAGVSRPVDQTAAGRRRCRSAARLAMRASRTSSPRRGNGYVPARHLAPLDVTKTDFVAVAERFARHAVSVGRQDQPRNRLFGPGAGFAQRRRHRLPARQRHAGGRSRWRG